MNKTFRLVRSAIITVSLALSLQAQAQHYQPGTEGIKGGSLPPPGFYVRDYNFVYTGELTTRLLGTVTEPGGAVFHYHYSQRDSFFTYMQAPRLLWMTDWKILGADYGMDVLVPFGYMEGPPRTVTTVIHEPGGRDITISTLRKSNPFGLGDIEVEPLLLSWHKKHFDANVGYAFWAPTGCFDADRLSIGKGFWTHMLSFGGVWYPDAEKTWAFSLQDRYEINTEQDQTHITYGNRNTLEWGLSKTIVSGVDIGVIGYYQQAVTRNHGPGTSGELEQVVGVGPEIRANWPKIGLSTSLRYVYETEAELTTRGHLVALTVTKKF